jgi:hypothetical protein
MHPQHHLVLEVLNSMLVRPLQQVLSQIKNVTLYELDKFT